MGVAGMDELSIAYGRRPKPDTSTVDTGHPRAGHSHDVPSERHKGDIDVALVPTVSTPESVAVVNLFLTQYRRT